MNIQVTLIGDILLKGTKQLFLLRNYDFYSWQNDCILIDMLSFIPVDILSHSAIPDECLNTTVTGLLKKTQTGKSMIANQESEIVKKSAATIDALLRVNAYKFDIVDQLYINSFQESLVDVILCKDENPRPNNDFSQSKQSLRLDNYQTKLINGHWILCWRFCNCDERTVCNPVMRLMIQNRSVQCVQKLFVHRSNFSSLDFRSQRQINSKEIFSIVVVLDIPNFLKKSLVVSTILTWYAASANEMDNELFLPEEKKVLIQHQISSAANLSVTDIFCQVPSNSFTIPEDLMYLKVLQQRIVLVVLCQYSDLSEVEKILSSSKELCLLESFNKKCLLFKNDSSPLFGVHFNLNVMNMKEVELEAFTKNDKEAYLLVHFLYHCLPEDAVILPNAGTRDELLSFKKQAVLAMKDEIDLLSASFHIYNVSDELRKDYSKLLTSSQAGTIIIPKENFYRIRRALTKKECLTDDVIKKLSVLSYDQ